MLVIHLAVLIELRLVIDGRTHGRRIEGHSTRRAKHMRRAVIIILIIITWQKTNHKIVRIPEALLAVAGKHMTLHIVTDRLVARTVQSVHCLCVCLSKYSHDNFRTFGVVV